MSTNWESLNPGAYLSAHDFNDKQVTLTIIAVDKQEFEKENEGGHEKRGVVTFKETELRWVLNKTNIALLKAIWPTVEDSIGHKVTLQAEEVQFGREKVLGIRVVGSPDLKNPIEATIKLPRRKPVKRKLVPTKPTAAKVERQEQPDEDAVQDAQDMEQEMLPVPDEGAEQDEEGVQIEIGPDIAF
jgi:hypothetical protein